nr:MAG TPA: hypothetical protein [Bacteriophage sp.]
MIRYKSLRTKSDCTLVQGCVCYCARDCQKMVLTARPEDA